MWFIVVGLLSFGILLIVLIYSHFDVRCLLRVWIVFGFMWSVYCSVIACCFWFAGVVDCYLWWVVLIVGCLGWFRLFWWYVLPYVLWLRFGLLSCFD